MNWRLAIVLLLLTGALVTGWKAWMGPPAPDADAAAEPRSDFILRDFEVITLDGAGKESFSLRAPELRQTPGARTLELTTPLFLMPDHHGSHWEIRSKTGWVNETSDEIRLRDDVVANSPVGASRASTMTTEELDVFPQKNLATSPAARDDRVEHHAVGSLPAPDSRSVKAGCGFLPVRPPSSPGAACP